MLITKGQGSDRDRHTDDGAAILALISFTVTRTAASEVRHRMPLTARNAPHHPA
jgi:hypothetical protein